MANKKKDTDEKGKKGKTSPREHSYSLYITGASPNSSRAIANVKFLFEKYLPGIHDLDIIDIYQQPHLAKEVNIIALPLLVRHHPLPEKRLMGDMSDHAKMIHSLSLSIDAL